MTGPALPPLAAQVESMVLLGLPDLLGVPVEELRRAADAEVAGALLVVHPDRAPASRLAPLLRHRGKPGFVVEDMTDVDDFLPIPEATPPDVPAYLLTGLDRGDELAGWNPDEALPAIAAAGRTPLLLSEGLQWVLQSPEVLARNHCFMTVESRRPLRTGPTARLDSRTPAVWLSNGTGRDSARRRDAPKVGWCWAGNRHSWLGFASAASRRALPASSATGR